MKKIILLILLALFLSGCYDYHELDELAIVNGIAIDKVDNEFLVTFEVLIDKMSDSGGVETSSILVEGNDTTISGAFKMVNDSVAKIVYLEHIEIVILSEDIAKNNFEEIVSYLLNYQRINSDFNLVIANSVNANEILDSSTNEFPITGEKIVDMINHDKNGVNVSTNLTFDDILIKFLEYGRDGYFTSIKKDGDNLSLDGYALFEGYTFKSFLTIEESLLFNILTSNSTNSIFTSETENGVITIKTSKAKSNIEIKNNMVMISTKISASIMENTTNLDIKSIESIFEEQLNEKIGDFYTTLIKNNSDVLEINYEYYKSTRNKKDIWKNLTFSIDIDLSLEKQGN